MVREVMIVILHCIESTISMVEPILSGDICLKSNNITGY